MHGQPENAFADYKPLVKKLVDQVLQVLLPSQNQMQNETQQNYETNQQYQYRTQNQLQNSVQTPQHLQPTQQQQRLSSSSFESQQIAQLQNNYSDFTSQQSADSQSSQQILKQIQEAHNQILLNPNMNVTHNQLLSNEQLTLLQNQQNSHALPPDVVAANAYNPNLQQQYQVQQSLTLQQAQQAQSAQQQGYFGQPIQMTTVSASSKPESNDPNTNAPTTLQLSHKKSRPKVDGQFDELFSYETVAC